MRSEKSVVLFEAPAFSAASLALLVLWLRNIVCVRLYNRAVDLNQRVPAGEIDSALIVYLDDLYYHLVTYVYNVLNLIHSLDIEL